MAGAPGRLASSRNGGAEGGDGQGSGAGRGRQPDGGAEDPEVREVVAPEAALNLLARGVHPPLLVTTSTVSRITCVVARVVVGRAGE